MGLGTANFWCLGMNNKENGGEKRTKRGQLWKQIHKQIGGFPHMDSGFVAAVEWRADFQTGQDFYEAMIMELFLTKFHCCAFTTIIPTAAMLLPCKTNSKHHKT